MNTLLNRLVSFLCKRMRVMYVDTFFDACDVMGKYGINAPKVYLYDWYQLNRAKGENKNVD